MKKPHFEIKRKLFHLVSLLYIVFYFAIREISNHKTALLVLVFILFFFLSLEFFRIVMKKKIPLFQTFYRENEENALGAHIYFTLGAIIVFAVFDAKIAVAALLMTTFGDMAAALIGTYFGRNWIKSIPNTAWEGIIAEFIVAFLVGALIISNLYIVLAMALVATFVETVFIHANDNLIIPVCAGLVGEILLILL